MKERDKCRRGPRLVVLVPETKMIPQGFSPLPFSSSQQFSTPSFPVSTRLCFCPLLEMEPLRLPLERPHCSWFLSRWTASLATGGRATKEHAFSAAMFEASNCPQHCWGHPLHSEQDTDWTEEGPGEGQSHSAMSPNVAKPVF